MADIILSFTITEAKAIKALEGYLTIYPNIEKNEDGSPKYTDKEWVLEKIKRNTVRDIHRGLQMKANREAIVPVDNDTVQ